MRRVVRRRDHDAVGEPGRASAVVCENRVRDDRGRRVFVALGEHDVHAVGGQDFKRARKRRHRERMRVHPEKQRAVDLVLLAVQANRLSDGQDVPLVERRVE